MPIKRCEILKRKCTSKRPLSQSSKISKASSERSNKKPKFTKVGTNAALHGLNKIPEYKIPIDKLHNAINILDSKTNPFLKEDWEKGCHLPAVTRERRFGAHNLTVQRLLTECRECLLNRDWTNLAGLLATVDSLKKESYSQYWRYFIKYAVICLLQVGEEESLDNFLCGVVGCANDYEKKVFLESLSSFSEDEIEQQIDSKESEFVKSEEEEDEKNN